NFCSDLKIDNALTRIRFGNVQTLCISASIGTGFWSGENGKKLKEFLWENYSDYFLDHAFVQAFLDAEKNNHSFEKIKNLDANTRFSQLDSFIPLNCIWSRLPTTPEIIFFEKKQPDLVRKALTSMLVEGNDITQLAYQAILYLSATP